MEKHDRVIAVFDGVYEAHGYDAFKPLHIPRFATLLGMWERTISISSAGKLFSATGVRVGWAVINLFFFLISFTFTSTLSFDILLSFVPY